MALDGARSPPKKTDWPDRHFAVGRTKHAFLWLKIDTNLFSQTPNRILPVSGTGISGISWYSPPAFV